MLKFFQFLFLWVLLPSFGVRAADPDRPPKLEAAAPRNGVFVNEEVEKGVGAMPNVKIMLKLEGGHFRYWVQHNEIPIPAPKLPYEGEYTVAGDTVTLHAKLDPDANPLVWTFKLLNGALTVWPASALKVYDETKRIPKEVALHETRQDPADLWKNGHR